MMPRRLAEPAEAEADRLRTQLAIIRECLETGAFTKALVVAREAAPRAAADVKRALTRPHYPSERAD